MLTVKDQEYFDSVVKFAQEAGLYDDLKKQLDFLSGFGGDPEKVECELYKDFAPQSFYFNMMKGDKRWFNGGLLYFESGDSGVGLPQLSVRIGSTKRGWEVHT
jgi:hypothetical protein